MAQINNPKWISRSFEIVQKKNGKMEFRINSVPIEKIAAKVPPPFYVYDAATIKRQYDNLYAALNPHGIDIYYSVKANTSLAVVKGLYMFGAGLEVASLGELLVAKKIGANLKNISFAGPVKTDEELSLALNLGIGTINVESESEFYRINSLAGKKGIKQRVGIRVNPPKEVEGAGGLMGGGSRKFGFDKEILDKKFFKKILALPSIDLAGVHVFAATQMLNSKAFIANIRNVCKTAENLNRFFEVKYVDFGGGLGIPYSRNEKHLPLAEISEKIGETLQNFPFLRENNTKLYMEPGRFLVGSSGVYVVRVDNVKFSRGKEIILVDGGVHHMLRPALAVGSSTHPVYNLSKIGELARGSVDIGGSLCTSLDFLAKGIPFPKTQPGDLIGVFNAGAYGWSEAMPFFLSHKIPAEVLVGNGKFSVIREAVLPSEFLKNQTIPKEKIF